MLQSYCVFLFLCIHLCIGFAGSCCCVQASLGAGSGRSPLGVVCGLLIVVASLVTRHGLKGSRASVVVQRLIASWHVGSSRIWD